jgi:protein-histidine pros-kinase
MKPRWSRLNSLPVRLFVLLWLALVLAHYLGYALQLLNSPEGQRPPLPPAVMALPPADGLPPPGGPRAPGPPHPPAPASPQGLTAPEPPPGPHDPPGAHGVGMLIDYGVRLLVFGLAAALAARWVSRPLSTLHASAGQLERQVLSGERPVPVPERDGPREVREVAAAYNRMSQRLVRQFEERAMMMAAVSHDLRTPLTRMRLRLELPATPEGKQAMLADLARMDGLIEQVLDTVRAERQPTQAVAVALPSFVQACVDDHAEAGRPVHWLDAGAPDEAQVHTLAQAQAVVRVDPQALRRVLDNLIDNAVRHGRAARVGVLRGPDQTVQVHVDDDGPGIPEADLERVLEPFARLDRARGTSTGGAGLGLYIARQLAMKQGALLTLSNRAEGGLRASLSWPAGASTGAP